MVYALVIKFMFMCILQMSFCFCVKLFSFCTYRSYVWSAFRLHVDKMIYLQKYFQLATAEWLILQREKDNENMLVTIGIYQCSSYMLKIL